MFYRSNAELAVVGQNVSLPYTISRDKFGCLSSESQTTSDCGRVWELAIKKHYIRTIQWYKLSFRGGNNAPWRREKLQERILSSCCVIVIFSWLGVSLPIGPSSCNLVAPAGTPMPRHHYGWGGNRDGLDFIWVQFQESSCEKKNTSHLEQTCYEWSLVPRPSYPRAYHLQ